MKNSFLYDTESLADLENRVPLKNDHLHLLNFFFQWTPTLSIRDSEYAKKFKILKLTPPPHTHIFSDVTYT